MLLAAVYGIDSKQILFASKHCGRTGAWWRRIAHEETGTIQI
jgi:hypothetical protein